MAISSKTSRAQLAAIIVKALETDGLSAVLVGGAVVSIYTKNKYESFDLDFVSPDDPQAIDKVMAGLGFTKLGKDYSHEKTKLTVEFPARSLAIGEMLNVKAKGRLKVGSITIRLYSPTQCVMDRLAAFYHWNDTEGLKQAVMVCDAQKVNLTEVEKWSLAEGELEKFMRFKTKVLGK